MAKSKKQSKSPAQILGLERMVLTAKNCRQRAEQLERRVKRGEFKKEEIASLAKRWAAWYRRRAKNGAPKVVKVAKSTKSKTKKAA